MHQQFTLNFKNNRHSLIVIQQLPENTLELVFKLTMTINESQFIGLPNQSVYCYVNATLQLLCFETYLKNLFMNYSGPISTSIRRIYYQLLYKDTLLCVDPQFAPDT